MSAHYHAIVWIDHHEARVFHFNISDFDRLVIHPRDRSKHLHHKANTIGSGHAAEDHEFLQKVADAIGNAGAVLITGPAGEKTELVKHIERHNPALKAKISAVEALDHPTDGQIVAHGRKHFAFDKQLPHRAN